MRQSGFSRKNVGACSSVLGAHPQAFWLVVRKPAHMLQKEGPRVPWQVLECITVPE